MEGRSPSPSGRGSLADREPGRSPLPRRQRLGSESAANRPEYWTCSCSGKVRPSEVLYNTQLEWPNPSQLTILTPGVP